MSGPLTGSMSGTGLVRAVGRLCLTKIKGLPALMRHIHRPELENCL